MTLYFIDRYEQETKAQEVETGLSIYGKAKGWMIALIVILSLSALIFLISMLSNVNEKQNSANDSYGNEATVSGTNEKKNSDADDISNASDHSKLEAQNNAESDQNNNTNDGNQNSENSESKLSISEWVSIGSAIALVLSLIALIILSYNANKKVSENIEDNLHKRFNVLEKVIRVIYYKKSEAQEHGDTSTVEECDVAKVKELISIYQDAIDNIKEEEKRINTLLIGILSVIGTCIATALSEIETLGITVYDWFRFVIFLLVIAAFVSLPIYFINEINPTREKYRTMLNLLRQYYVYRIEDDIEE